VIRAATLALGLAFGFLLSRGRASDYDAIVAMFRLRDPHLALLMATAIVTAAAGLAALRRFGARTLDGRLLALECKPLHLGTVVGGAIFGVGWGLSGQCPGTALAQIGEGKLLAVVTVLGMLAGTWAYGALADRLAFLTRPREAKLAPGPGPT
jgi:uncharacterized membrane protein YedE/YeeE